MFYHTILYIKIIFLTHQTQLTATANNQQPPPQSPHPLQPKTQFKTNLPQPLISAIIEKF